MLVGPIAHEPANRPHHGDYGVPAVDLFGGVAVDRPISHNINPIEFIALERQGFTLARSLALAEADRDQQFARRRLSAETMTHLLPLVGLGSSLRARVFQPNGLLLA